MTGPKTYLLNKSHVDEYKKEISISTPVKDFDNGNALYLLLSF